MRRPVRSFNGSISTSLCALEGAAAFDIGYLLGVDVELVLGDRDQVADDRLAEQLADPLAAAEQLQCVRQAAGQFLARVAGGVDRLAYRLELVVDSVQAGAD